MEITNLISVYAWVIVSLAYCYFLVAKLRPGPPRLILLLPVFYLFSTLPLTFSTIHFRGISAFFLTWLGNFKLFLFSFDRGPLANSSSSSSASFLRFLSLASLPVKDQTGGDDSTKPSTKNEGRPRHPLDLAMAIRTLLLAIIIPLYRYKHHLPHHALLAIYCLHMYLALEVLLAAAAALAHALTPLELEPQFREPYFSTSLQDFWGRRWNLMVTSILRPTVYHPVRRWAGPVFGARPAQLLGILAVFAMSGIMHEAMYYYITLAGPTWEVSCFFLLHGVATVAEVVVKKAVAPYRLPPVVSGGLTLTFVTVTGFWLFFPPITRSGTDTEVINEYKPLIQFITNAYHIVEQRLISIAAT